MLDTDEVSEIADRAKNGDAEAPPKRRRHVTARSKREDAAPAESASDALPERSMEDLSADELLPRELPKPTENVKTLGDLNAKYDIGDTPDFKLQVWRLYPKLFPGGVKADGFYDTWDQPLNEEMVQSEYGGGTYRIAVVGPHPTKPNRTKHYDSLQLSLPGEAKFERLPRAMQNTAAAADHQQPAPLPVMGSPESPKLAEKAMTILADTVDKERAERIRVEDRARDDAANARSIIDPLVEAHSKRADDLVRVERERSDMERRLMAERLEEERRERHRLAEKLEDVMREVQVQRGSVASEAGGLVESMAKVFGPRADDGKAAERMLESVLEKHKVELDSIRDQHRQMIESLSKQHADTMNAMRGAHQIEVQALRESQVRELSAERDAGRRREERVEDQLKMEREERRRDQERQRELLEANDRQWKDRLEMQKLATEQSWEGRHQSVVANYENRILWQQQEIDRLKADLTENRAKMIDHSDPIAIVHKAKEIKDAIGVPETAPSSSGGGGSGGIGMSGEDWRNILAEGAAERLPAILQTVGNLLGGNALGGQPQQAQQVPQVGSIIQTPQGEMVVVPAPNMPGGVALARRSDIEAQMRQEQEQARMLPSGRRQRSRRVMPGADEMPERRRKPTISAVPNLAEGLPKPRAPWDGPAPEERQERRQESRGAQQDQQSPPAQGRQLKPVERQGLRVVAKLVHESVMNADEPEEFVQKILSEWQPDTLRRVVGDYSVEEIASGIAQLAPQSAGATPAGQAFMREAFARLRGALG